MFRLPFNTNWSVRPAPALFAEYGGTADEPRPVILPHDAMLDTQRSTAGEGPSSGHYSGGVFEYSKTFQAAAEWCGGRVELLFEAVYRDAVVFINGQWAGQRPAGYSEFIVDATPFLRFGEQNTVRVEARIHRDSRWYSGGGIHRGVTLLVGGTTHIVPDGVRVTTPDVDAHRAVIAISTEVRNDATTTRTVFVEHEIVAPDGRTLRGTAAPVTLAPRSSETVRHRVYDTEPRLWSPETPQLYRVRTALGDGPDQTRVDIDSTECIFGIRTIQLDPSHGLRINGSTVKLRGACIHHDNGVLGAAAIPRADERRVELLKAAGFNAIRASHNPLSRAMLEACDRLGMLVMDETFDMWTLSKNPFDYSLAFPEWWERDVESMVRKDFNHPSVILYSIGNEIPDTGTPMGSRIGRHLAEKVRTLDPTRPVTNGINGMLSVLDELRHSASSADEPIGINTLMTQLGTVMGEVTSSDSVTRRLAESFSVVDVVGLNYGETRYEADLQSHPDRIFVGSETFPAQIARNWDLVLRNSHVIGDFTWTGIDYLGEAGLGRVAHSGSELANGIAAAYPWLTAWCGDLDLIGDRRPASFYREIVFGLRREPYIAVQRPRFHGAPAILTPWSWSDSVSSWSWSAAPGDPVTVEVYSDAEEVELVLNGRSFGRKPSGAATAFRTEFELGYEPGELLAVAWRAGEATETVGLQSASASARVVLAVDRPAISAGPDDLAYVTVTIEDASGIRMLDSDRLLEIEVTGAGELAGFGSAAPSTAESFTDQVHTTFDGRALAVVRPTGIGEIHIRVRSADGLSDELIISAG
ncbi:glycoside hydrolase family 2 TIM barrel-domain containing protein [Protaetiibacter intestinalis]|uniref:Glycoside hydrolase family 2 protein n=1 Tax=Protaetiibacter intestinalis TaxID=2419774 RepID=A0A387BBF8_9MICO|nr:glycoside hydrolase family 2 TIM barrel-domain containing protein [Protaetiibacter intestinalis]AYF99261.1 glycoside hydrolase family 2 protein [Protaetiibacter intestinalis]